MEIKSKRSGEREREREREREKERREREEREREKERREREEREREGGGDAKGNIALRDMSSRHVHKYQYFLLSPRLLLDWFSLFLFLSPAFSPSTQFS